MARVPEGGKIEGGKMFFCSSPNTEESSSGFNRNPLFSFSLLMKDWGPGRSKWVWTRQIQRPWARKPPVPSHMQNLRVLVRLWGFAGHPLMTQAVQSSQGPLQLGQKEQVTLPFRQFEWSRCNAPRGSFPNIYVPGQQSQDAMVPNQLSQTS